MMQQATELIAQQYANGAANKKVWSDIIFNVKAYGAVGDGSNDDSVAFTKAVAAAAVTGGMVFFPPGTYITSSQTVPSNVTLWFANGAKLSVNSGVTVAINGPIEAGLHQIFSGSGKVAGRMKVDKLYVDWWGAAGGEVTDDTAAIQAAIDYVQNNINIPIWFQSLSYKVGTLTILHGAPYKGVTLQGNNCLLRYTGTTGAQIVINPVNPDSEAATGNGVMHWELHDMQMAPYAAGTHTGLLIGKDGYNVDDFASCLVENVSNAAFNTGINIISARHITFKDVVVRTPLTVGLLIQTNGEPCGDMNFLACEFLGGTEAAIKIYSYGVSVFAEVRGLHFTDCVVYGNSAAAYTVLMTCSGYGRLLDTWFNNCAFDAGFNIGFGMSCIENGLFGFFQIHNCYAVNFTQFLDFSNTSSYTNDDILIDTNMIGLCAFPFNVYNCSNLTITNNTFKDVTAKSAITGPSKNTIISNNRFWHTSTKLPSQCFTVGPDVKSIIVANNFGNFADGSTFIENQTTLPGTKLVDSNNLQYDV